MPNTISVHSEYNKSIGDWKQIETCLDGESFIKAEGEKYLPFPVALDADERKEADFKSQYSIYLAGAHYVNYTLQAVEDLVAGVFRKSPILEKVPEELKYFDSKNFTKEAVEIVTSYGRSLVLVDYPTVEEEEGTTVAKENKDNIRAYTILYKPQDILDWQTKRVGGIEVLIMVLLREVVYSDNEEGVSTESYRYRKLSLDEEGLYLVEVKDDEETTTATFKPVANGSRLDHIPATFIGSKNNTPRVNTSPIIGISNSNIKHYQTWAELDHIQTYAGHPMIAITGAPKGFIPKGFIKEMKKNDIKMNVGASNALVLEGDQANANILTQASESNIMHFKTLAELKSSMEEQGARIKESQGGQVESAEALTIKYSGDNSILASIAINVELATQFVYKELALFMNVNADNTTIVLNKTFIEKSADPAVMGAISSAVATGNLPNRIFLQYLQENNIVSDTEDLDALVLEAIANNPFKIEE